MATYTSSAAQTDVEPKSLRVGLSGLSVKYDATAISISAGTVFSMIKMPKGARVLFMSYGAESTTAGQYELGIGDSVSATRYRSVATLSSLDGMVMASTFNQNYVYSADDTISMTISVATAASVGGRFYLNVIYGMDTGA